MSDGGWSGLHAHSQRRLPVTGGEETLNITITIDPEKIAEEVNAALGRESETASSVTGYVGSNLDSLVGVITEHLIDSLVALEG